MEWRKTQSDFTRGNRKPWPNSLISVLMVQAINGTPLVAVTVTHVRRCQAVGSTHSAFCSLLTRIILRKYSEYSSVAQIVAKWFVVYCLSNSTVCLSPPQGQNKLSEPICFKFKRPIYYGEFKCFIDRQIKVINLKLSPECVNQNSWQHIWSVLQGGKNSGSSLNRCCNFTFVIFTQYIFVALSWWHKHQSTYLGLVAQTTSHHGCKFSTENMFCTWHNATQITKNVNYCICKAVKMDAGHMRKKWFNSRLISEINYEAPKQS